MEPELFKELKKELPDIKKNVLLKSHTTFKVGGPAKYFLKAEKKETILKALALAKKLKIPLFILGGGSNVLASDKGFAGLVLKIENKNISLVSPTVIEAGAGVVFADLVRFAISHSLEGLEWAGGLPGTFGGAIRGNAGAFGGEVKDSIVQVQALDSAMRLRSFSPATSRFSYRSSIFKKKNWIIISARVKLKRGIKEHIQKIADARITYRKEKHPLEYPSAGSVFKNIDVKKIPPRFRSLFADKVKNDPFPIVPSAWFIIGAGLTGRKVGRAQISKKHSNYIINLGNASAKDILTLINFVKIKIKKKYGIILEEEIHYLK